MWKIRIPRVFVSYVCNSVFSLQVGFLFLMFVILFFPSGRNVVLTRAMVASAPKREKDPKKRVVITGMGLVSVFGNDVDTFYEKLLEGQSGISLIDRFDASQFPTRFAGQIKGFSSEGYIDGKNDRRLDDCLRYCLVSGKKALENANLGSENLSTVMFS